MYMNKQLFELIGNIREHSKADKAGLVEGDVILCVNNICCEGLTHFMVTALTDLSDMLCLLVLRNMQSVSEVKALFDNMGQSVRRLNAKEISELSGNPNLVVTRRQSTGSIQHLPKNQPVKPHQVKLFGSHKFIQTNLNSPTKTVSSFYDRSLSSDCDENKIKEITANSPVSSTPCRKSKRNPKTESSTERRHIIPTRLKNLSISNEIEDKEFEEELRRENNLKKFEETQKSFLKEIGNKRQQFKNNPFITEAPLNETNLEENRTTDVDSIFRGFVPPVFRKRCMSEQPRYKSNLLFNLTTDDFKQKQIVVPKVAAKVSVRRFSLTVPGQQIINPRSNTVQLKSSGFQLQSPLKTAQSQISRSSLKTNSQSTPVHTNHQQSINEPSNQNTGSKSSEQVGLRQQIQIKPSIQAFNKNVNDIKNFQKSSKLFIRSNSICGSLTNSANITRTANINDNRCSYGKQASQKISIQTKSKNENISISSSDIRPQSTSASIHSTISTSKTQLTEEGQMPTSDSNSKALPQINNLTSTAGISSTNLAHSVSEILITKPAIKISSTSADAFVSIVPTLLSSTLPATSTKMTNNKVSANSFGRALTSKTPHISSSSIQQKINPNQRTRSNSLSVVASARSKFDSNIDNYKKSDKIISKFAANFANQVDTWQNAPKQSEKLQALNVSVVTSSSSINTTSLVSSSSFISSSSSSSSSLSSSNNIQSSLSPSSHYTSLTASSSFSASIVPISSYNIRSGGTIVNNKKKYNNTDDVDNFNNSINDKLMSNTTSKIKILTAGRKLSVPDLRTVENMKQKVTINSKSFSKNIPNVNIEPKATNSNHNYKCSDTLSLRSNQNEDFRQQNLFRSSSGNEKADDKLNSCESLEGLKGLAFTNSNSAISATSQANHQNDSTDQHRSLSDRQPQNNINHNNKFNNNNNNLINSNVYNNQFNSKIFTTNNNNFSNNQNFNNNYFCRNHNNFNSNLNCSNRNYFKIFSHKFNQTFKKIHITNNHFNKNQQFNNIDSNQNNNFNNNHNFSNNHSFNNNHNNINCLTFNNIHNFNNQTYSNINFSINFNNGNINSSINFNNNHHPKNNNNSNFISNNRNSINFINNSNNYFNNNINRLKFEFIDIFFITHRIFSGTSVSSRIQQFRPNSAAEGPVNVSSRQRPPQLACRNLGFPISKMSKTTPTPPSSFSQSTFPTSPGHVDNEVFSPTQQKIFREESCLGGSATENLNSVVLSQNSLNKLPHSDYMMSHSSLDMSNSIQDEPYSNNSNRSTYNNTFNYQRSVDGTINNTTAASYVPSRSQQRYKRQQDPATSTSCSQQSLPSQPKQYLL
ncbi:hypothetical protein HELRODRAFT_190075 [Helobdella robusta]|uniref:Uncharacterized protein n=1 Tax=Helobdella robusta TaxID=6412 RepID=T1FRN6_HELRO|nr:hypothetical protein HELRODRAFT_190075 [Helobdella robusta]ESO11924.1 hypothetical protein HELRODRAFT_190075 [Helobdella robusta]